MDVQSALQSQYHAALKMLREVIDKCPDSLWEDSTDGVPMWRVVYHALFFTHFYLQKDHQSFTPWDRHRDEAHYLNRVPRTDRAPKSCEAYARDDLLAYWKICDDMIDAGVNALDLTLPESGFPWYRMSKLEHQLVNVRHLQHHIGALAGRLRRTAGIEVPWIGGGH
jgi:hypothetical protein